MSYISWKSKMVIPKSASADHCLSSTAGLRSSGELLFTPLSVFAFTVLFFSCWLFYPFLLAINLFTFTKCKGQIIIDSFVTGELLRCFVSLFLTGHGQTFLKMQFSFFYFTSPEHGQIFVVLDGAELQRGAAASGRCACFSPLAFRIRINATHMFPTLRSSR